MEVTQTVNISEASIEALAGAIGDAVSVETTVTIPESVSISDTLTVGVASIGPFDAGGILALIAILVIVCAFLIGERVDRWTSSRRS